MQQGLTNDYRSRSLPTEEAHEEAADRQNHFFRILRVEYAKFFTMATLYFFIVLAYSILRDTKDVIVIGRMLPASIQYLKSFVVMGATMGFVIFYQFLLAKGITLERIMFSLNIGFGIFFIIYTFILLPTTEYIEPYKYWINDIFADGKMFVNGLDSLKGLFLTVNFWTGTLLYTAAELWGNIMTSVMFFAIANEICPLRQALRFYPLFIIAANLGLITSGLTMVLTSSYLEIYPDRTTGTVMALIAVVSVICAINFSLYRHLVKNILPYPIYIIYDNNQKAGKKKEKVSMMDGFKIMFKTPIVFHLAITVLAYGISTNLTEGAYKSGLQIASAESTKTTSTTVMRTQGLLQCSIGFFVIVVLFSPIKQFIQKKGWLSLGIITPVMTLICGVSFLLYVCGVVSSAAATPNDNVLVKFLRPFFSSISGFFTSNFEMTVGFVAVNVIKILKYAAFDVCKEAIGVKIPKQYRARFKGVYDGVFGKLGKSLSSYIQIFLAFYFNTIDIRTVAPILALTIGVVSILWIFSTLYLATKYSDAVREDRDIDIGETDKTVEKAKKAIIKPESEILASK
ncbi:ATP:ADP antiporter, AAA family [Nematocida sp. LUAm3]|nr:ATP:ADP antiporter, AAA family [Nematocida sp. LUAm3]KAI5175623.1 ATP:ADP antiporter, AAA family [Nematocida sp. LUAm2]KAI5178529.1 ATP:ADP antiporter, AAA family [Nematocida sp. LUAm1]